jgi:hypothetical protein
MAASPNSATRSRSSSAATPDGIFDEPEPELTDNIGCSHISALLADPTESEPLLNTFRRVVTWKARRTHDALHSAKRRKVRLSIRIPVSPVHLYVSIGGPPHLWDVRTSNSSSICVPRLCLLWLLARRPYRRALERRKTQILYVYLYPCVASLALTIYRCRHTTWRRILQGMSRHDLRPHPRPSLSTNHSGNRGEGDEAFRYLYLLRPCLRTPVTLRQFRREASTRALSIMEARREGHSRARQHQPAPLPRPTRATKPRPNMLPQCDAPSAPTQPAPAKLLPRGQTQPALVQEQRRLRLLRARPPFRRNLRPTSPTSLRPNRAPRDDLARRGVPSRIRTTRRPRVPHRSPQRSPRQRAWIHPPQVQLHRP